MSLSFRGGVQAEEKNQAVPAYQQTATVESTYKLNRCGSISGTPSYQSVMDMSTLVHPGATSLSCIHSCKTAAYMCAIATFLYPQVLWLGREPQVLCRASHAPETMWYIHQRAQQSKEGKRVLCLYSLTNMTPFAVCLSFNAVVERSPKDIRSPCSTGERSSLFYTSIRLMMGSVLSTQCDGRAVVDLVRPIQSYTCAQRGKKILQRVMDKIV